MSDVISNSFKGALKRPSKQWHITSTMSVVEWFAFAYRQSFYIMIRFSHLENSTRIVFDFNSTQPHLTTSLLIEDTTKNHLSFNATFSSQQEVNVWHSKGGFCITLASWKLIYCLAPTLHYIVCTVQPTWCLCAAWEYSAEEFIYHFGSIPFDRRESLFVLECKSNGGEVQL